MFFVPAWITNFIYLGTCWLSGFQLAKLARPNPVMNLQFMMIVFCLLMTLMVALYNQENPWLSLVFLLIALCNLGVIIRQQRMLPPGKRLE